jgi:hypothetical protein
MVASSLSTDCRDGVYWCARGWKKTHSASVQVMVEDNQRGYLRPLVYRLYPADPSH